MKNIFLTFFLLSYSFTAVADDVLNTITTELAKIEINGNLSVPNYCEIAKSTNKLIALGEGAVTPLSSALLSKNVGLQTKFRIARALGEIGNSNAISALEEANKASSSDNTWLKYEIEQALKLIRGQLKSSGKVYVYTIGVQTTRTDCETGTIEIMK